MIAVPTYPYDPHSVWNRNQLGSLDLSMSTLAMVGIAAYVAMKLMKGRKLF